MKHFLLYLLLFIFFISCNREIIDSRCIIFNLYTSKKVPSHSITLDFKDKSIFIHNIANEGIFEFNPPPPPPSYNIKWTSAYSIYPKGKVIDNKISQKTDKLFIKINNILNEGQPFSCSFRPTQKELDIFNLVRDFILTNDTVNADKWKLFYDK